MPAGEFEIEKFCASSRGNKDGKENADGTAAVRFERREDAEKALQQLKQKGRAADWEWNERPYDGALARPSSHHHTP